MIRETLNNIFSMKNRLIYSIWILFNFIPYLNGLGFIYIGAKTSKKNWIMEGIIYEIPSIITFFLIPIDPKITLIPILFVIITMIVGFIRSIIINPKYQKIIENNNYKKSKNRFITFIYEILSLVPIINGLTFIYIGRNSKSKNLMILGALFGISWILSIATNNKFINGISFASILISPIVFTIINYRNRDLSIGYVETNNTQPPKKEPKTVRDIINIKTGNSSKPYEGEKKEIKTLEQEFNKKYKKATQLIEEQFKSSQITYSRFISIINNAQDNFDKQTSSALKIIELSSDYDKKIENELKKKINDLKMINEKLEELILELIINVNDNENSDKDLNMLFEDMDELIDSVKEYN